MEPSSLPASGADKVFRTPEIEEASNRYFIHPLSRYLVGHFARWGWSPNMVSLLGMCSALGAAILLYHYHSPLAVTGGILLLVGWHVLDGADGQLARLTGNTSELGKIIDGLCDHLGVAMVYVSLSMALSAEFGIWVWLVTVGAGISHVIQAGAFEFQRNMYDCWVHGKTGKCVPPLETLARQPTAGDLMHRLIHRAHLFYVRIQYRFAAVDPRLTALGPEFAGEAAAEVAEVYRELNQSSVLSWSWLSANKRTIAWSVLCLLQAPLYYFLLELSLLNLLLWRLQRKQSSLNSELVDRLERRTRS